MTHQPPDAGDRGPLPEHEPVILVHGSAHRRPWHRLPAVLTWFVGLALLGALALQVAGWWLVPLLDANPQWVRTLLSRELKRPVRFGEFEAVWRRTGPLLQLRGLEIEDPTRRTPPLKLARAEFAVHIYAWTRPGSPWTEFRVVAPRLSVERDVAGKWRLRGFDGQQVAADGNVLLDVGRVSLSDASVEVLDRASGSRWQFDRVHARIENDWLGRRFGAHARARESAQPVRIACRSDKDWREGRCFAAGLKLALRNWQPQRAAAAAAWPGEVDLAAWFDWKPGARSLRADVGVRGLESAVAAALDSKAPTPLTAPTEPSTTRWRLTWQETQSSGWQLDARHAGGDTLRLRGRDGEIAVTTPRLELANWLPLLALAPQLSGSQRDWVRQAALRGTLVDLDAHRSGAHWRKIHGSLRGAGWNARGATPGLSGLDAKLSGDGSALLVSPLPRSRLVIASPDFSKPLAVDWRGGVVGVMPSGDGMRIEGAGLDFAVDSARVEGRFGLDVAKGGGKPFADFALGVDRVAIERLRNYWPRTRMPPKTVRWLDDSLRSGQVRDASVLLHGDLDDWPFREGEGRFEARARVADTELAFRPDWPVATITAADIAFVGGSMHVDIERARTAGLEVTAGSADIERLGQPILEIRTTGHGPGNAMLDYLRASPIRDKVGPAIEGLTIDGRGELTLALHIPLKKSLGETAVEGSVVLADADLADSKWDIELDDASGTVQFDRRSFIAKDWTVRFDGDPARLDLRSGEHVLDSGRNEFEAQLRGDLRAESLLARVPQLSPLSARFEGRSDFDVRVSIGHAQQASQRLQRLEIDSSLRGIALTLPAPLDKPADAALPLKIGVDLPIDRGEVQIALGGVLRARARAADATRPFTAHFALGATDLPELPQSGIRVSGRAGTIEVLGWNALVRELDTHLESMPATSPARTIAQTREAVLPATGATSNPPSATAATIVPARTWTVAQRFAGLDLAADSWMLGLRPFGALAAKGAVVGETLRFEVAGGTAQGEVRIPLGKGTEALTVRFDRLHLPESKPGTKTPRKKSNVDPAKVPLLVVDIADFRMGRAHLGKVVLRARPLARGMRVDTLTARGPGIRLDAEGEWLRDGGGERSQVLAEFRSPDLGKLLTALGFEGVVAGGVTRAELNGNWRGAPMDFALANIEGTLGIAVGPGRILDVEPGAGRLFGLVNLQAIRRRLSLDFSDFFTPGMAFDRIDGDFKMRAGNAYTANVILKSPAAEVRVRGRTGLAGKDYDQQVEVLPRVGSALPVVGAVAAGPAGAALGWVMQRALEKPLGLATRTRYRITGPWSKPVITQLPRIPRRPNPPEPAAGK